MDINPGSKLAFHECVMLLPAGVGFAKTAGKRLFCLQRPIQPPKFKTEILVCCRGRLTNQTIQSQLLALKTITVLSPGKLFNFELCSQLLCCF